MTPSLLAWGLGTSALVAGVSASLLTRWTKRLSDSENVWLDRRVHVALAAFGGVGAAAVAGYWAEALAFVVLAVALALLFVVDLAEHRLPDRIVIPMYGVLLVLLTLAAAVAGDWGNLGRAALAGASLFAVYFVIAFAYPPGMGLGDVKLSGLLGIFLGWLGWPHVVLGTLAAFLLNAMVALIVLLLRKVDRKGEVPFGPSMIIGAAVGAAWGPLVFTGIA